MADNDPSAVGAFSAAGAQLGYGLLWLVPLGLPLMIAVQEMCGRIGAVTGKGLAAVIKEKYPPWVLYAAVLLLTTANVITIWADLHVMAASAQMLFGLPLWVWLVTLAAAVMLPIIRIPYGTYVRYLKWMALSLLAYVATAVLPGVHNPWIEIGRKVMAPRVELTPASLLLAVGILGSTISPYLFFWQAGETVEEEVKEGAALEPGHRLRKVTDDEMRHLRTDTFIGMLASQVIVFIIIVCTAAMLHAKGITQIETAQDAAIALRPLGPAGYWLFTLAILASGLLAIPTLAGSAAYAIADTVGWRYGLFRRTHRARGFYWTIAAVISLGCVLNFFPGVSPIRGLLYAAALNGVVAPPLVALLVLLCNNRETMGEHVNGPISNALGWLTVLLMGSAAAAMLWSLASG